MGHKCLSICCVFSFTLGSQSDLGIPDAHLTSFSCRPSAVWEGSPTVTWRSELRLYLNITNKYIIPSSFLHCNWMRSCIPSECLFRGFRWIQGQMMFRTALTLRLIALQTPLRGAVGCAVGWYSSVKVATIFGSIVGSSLLVNRRSADFIAFLLLWKRAIIK